MQPCPQQNCLYALLTTTTTFYFMSGENDVCYIDFTTRFYNFVPAFQKLSKGGNEIVQACSSCWMPGFCTSIGFVFILGVELFDYVVDGGEFVTVWMSEPNWGYGLKMERIKPLGCHPIWICLTLKMAYFFGFVSHYTLLQFFK